MKSCIRASAMLLFLATGAARAEVVPAAASVPPPAITPDVSFALLDPKTSDTARATALQAMVAAALDGDGRASHLLGALFRSGTDHPSRATARDPDTARTWLERCLTQVGCPRTVFATLAELELDAGNAPRAMLWAQLAALSERELHRRLRGNGVEERMLRRQPYNAALLRRVYDALPPDQRDTAVDTALQGWLAKHEGLLLRIIEDELAGRVAPGGPQLEYDVSRPRIIPHGPIATHAFFLVRVPPESSQHDGLLLIDGLPRPQDAVPLRRIARDMRYKPYVAEAGETARYAVAPVSLDDGRFALTKEAAEGGE